MTHSWPNGWSRPAGRSGWWALLALVAGVLFLYSYRLGAAGLFELDEARYAAVAREMAESGDWLIPRLNGIIHLTKPPLAYWSGAVAFRLLGPTELAARLGPLAAALTTLAAVWGIGRRLAGPAAALWAVAVLATSPEFFVMGRTLTTDIFLTAGCTLAILGAVSDWRAVDARAAAAAAPAAARPADTGAASGRGATGGRGAETDGGTGRGEAAGRSSAPRDASRRASRRGVSLFWGGLAVAFLAKGPVAVLVVGGALGGYAAVSADRARFRGLLHWWGLLLFAGVGLTWYALAASRTPGLAGYWLSREVLGRVASDVHHRSGPWYYFVPVLALGFLPWSVLLPVAAVEPAAAGAGAAGRRLLLAWLLVPLGLFSLSRSKLPTYLLPVLPAAALLVGGYLARLPALVGTRGTRWTGCAFALLAVVIAAGLAVVGWRAPQVLAGALAADDPLLEEAAEVLGPLAVGASLGAAALLTGRAGLARAAWVAGAGLMLVQAVHELPDVAAVQSLKGLAAMIDGGPGDRVAMYRLNRYGLRFYTDRPVLEVGGGRDLRFEVDPREADRRVAPADDGALVAASKEAAATGGRLFVLARAADAGRLQALVPGRLEPVGRAGALVLLATAPPASRASAGPRGDAGP